MTVEILPTRVQAPVEDDWRKLRRVLKYLKGTIHMPLILWDNSLGMIKWWVGAAYATHGDIKEHIRANMLLGRRSVICMSKKQKINMQSSIEAEIVGRMIPSQGNCVLVISSRSRVSVLTR